MAMTTGEVGDRLGVDPTTVLRWIHDGVFPNAYRKNPRSKRSHWLIPEGDVQSLEEERKGRQDDATQRDNGN